MSAAIDRRQFLGHVGAFGSALLSSQGAAPGGRQRPQRVAVIGADHYHATSTPNYLRILQTQKVDIVGVHAPETAVAERWAKEYRQHAVHRLPRAGRENAAEFVIALGHHAAMPAEFRYLVDAGVPFLMEKPWGTDAGTVNQLAELAEKRNAWAAVPMPFRYSWFAETAVAMRERGELGAISHGSMRFNQPGVQRYRDLGSPWMLSKKETGGGALINLGIHGFDLSRYLTGEEPRVVSAVTSHSMHKLEIEDYAHVTMKTPSGVIFVNEASYTFPGNGSDQERRLSAERVHLRATTSGGEGVQLSGPGATRPAWPPLVT